MILAGDIGGTKVNLGIFEAEGESLRLAETGNYPVREYSEISEVLTEFIRATGCKPEVLSLGVAGPVVGQTCRLTNISWEVDAENLKNRLGLSHVYLVNDLAAGAAGIPFLEGRDFRILQKGRPINTGRKAIVSAGTGLGQAFLIPDENNRLLVVDTEGGQSGLPAYSIEDLAIIQYFHGLSSPVSVEHVLSGEGLVHLYRYYFEQGDEGKSGTSIPELTAEEIVIQSQEEEEGASLRAVNHFVSFLGGVAGDLALQGLASGGVYLGGGIAPAIFQTNEGDTFLHRFNNRDKFNEWMKDIPVYLVLNEFSPLWGAAGLAVGKHVAMARH